MSIIIKNIHKTYGKKENQVKALNGISLQINESEVIAIMGKSGCGKSTLLHIVAGYLKPSEGEVTFDTVNITNLKDAELVRFQRENIGFIFQFFNLFEELTVYENIQFVIDIAKKNTDSREIMSLLELLDIEDKKDKFPSQLSGGQQQRVTIARALILKPKLILADEPTGNLDQKTSQEVLSILLKMREIFGVSILIATHDKDVASLADKVYQMVDGKIYY